MGLVCPPEVFVQLFHERAGDIEFGPLVRGIDWQGVTWDEAKLTGVALREVHVDRRFERAVDEARARTIAEGVQDPRPDVVDSWDEQGTWLVPPVVVTGYVTGSAARYDLLVGCSRLGNLLGLLDLGAVPEGRSHRVWLGTSTELS
jgi:hypothetical protein